MTHKPILSDSSLLKLLTAAVIFTLSFFALAGWHVWDNSQQYNKTVARHARLRELAAEINGTGTNVTASAHTAVVQGNPEEQARYGRLLRQLNATLKNAKELAPDASSRAAVAQIEAANTTLVELEDQALALARQGQREAALTLISSEAYKAQQMSYDQGVDRLYSALGQAISADVARQRRRALIVIGTGLAAVPILALLWLAVLRTVHRYLAERNRAEEALRTAKDELERRVEERTGCLAKTVAELRSEIAERERTQEALRATEKQLQRLLDWSSVVIYSCQPSGDYPATFVSANIQTQLGYSVEEFLGDPGFWAQRIHPEDAPRVFAELPRLFRQDHYQHEYRFRHKDGTYRWVLDSMQVVRDGTGSPVELIGSWQDITERKRAAQAMQDSEQRFRQLVEHMHDALIVDDAAGKITFANDQFLALFGFERQQVPHLQLEDYVAPEWRERLRERHERRVRGEQVHAHFEYEGLRQDGRRLWLEEDVVPLLDNTGRVIGTQSAIRDITERKQAEETLRESETRYRDLVENIQDLICTHDLEGRVLSANPASARLLGYAPEELVGTNIRDLIAPETRHLFDEYLASIRNEGQASGFMRLQSRSGEKRLWEYRNTLRTEGLAQPIVRGFARDVTERKRAEKALRISEERFQLVAQAAHAAVWDWNLVTDEGWRHEMYQSLFGHPAGYCASGVDTWSNHLHADDKARVLAGLHDAIHSKKVGWFDEYRFRRSDGSYAYVLDRGRVMYDNAGRPVRMIGVIADMTRRHELEEQLHQAEKMEVLGQMAGGIAHDFGNLLVGINLYAGLLCGKVETDPDAGNYVREIQRSVEIGTSLTHQLLAFGRKQALSPEVLDLNAVLGETSNMLRRLIGENIRLVVIPCRSPAWILADRSQIEVLLINLAVNARDAMPAGGTLEIKSGTVEVTGDSPAKHPISPGKYAELTVRDTGIGMDPGTKQHIFEFFFTTKPKGTGLGLSLAYGIVKHHGGDVVVESEPGQGTTFTIYFPAAGAPAELQDAKEDAHQRTEASKTILLIEDNGQVRDSLFRYLTSQGYTVLVASCGEEAAELAKNCGKPIHLVVSDVVMPGMSGPETVERIRSLQPEAKVLYISGYWKDRESHVAEASFLRKPFTAEEMGRKVRELMAGPRRS